MLLSRLRDGSGGYLGALVARRWDVAVVAACLGMATMLCWDLLATGPRACHQDWVIFHTASEVTRRTLLEHGALPFWDPYTCGGIEHLGDPQAAFLSPLFPLVAVFGSFFGLKLFAWAHFAIGLVGGVRLGRELGLDRIWSLAIAAVVAAMPFHVWHLNAGHIPFLQLLWLPWIVWSYLAARRNPALALWGAAFLGVALLSGGTYVGPFAAVLLGAHALLAAVVERPRWRPLASALIILAGGVVLAAAKVLPSMAFVRQFERTSLADEVLGLEQLWRSFFDISWPATEMRLPVWELGNYLGWCGGLLVLLAAAGARRAWPWLLVAALSLSLTIGNFAPWAPYSLLRRLPVFESLRVPSRYTMLLVFALAMAAAAGVVAIRAWLDARGSGNSPGADVSGAGDSDRSSEPGSGRGVRAWRGARWRKVLSVGMSVLGLAASFDMVNYGRRFLPGHICRDAPGPVERPARFHLILGSFEYMFRTVRKGLGTTYCNAPMKMRAIPAVWLGNYEQVRVRPASAGQARVTELGVDRWRVHVAVTGPAVLHLNQNYRPSFVASHGRVIDAEGLVGVELEPGTYDLEIAYRPREAFLGFAISGASWLLLAAFAVHRVIRRRRGAHLLEAASGAASEAPSQP
jgi:hypothetical protein